MKRFACVLGAALGFTLGHSVAHAQWGGPATGGDDKSAPPLNKLFGHRTDGKKWTAEEERLQMYWRDYYRSLRDYYASLESVDWVAYYKKNGYPIDPAFYNPNGITPAGGTVPVPVMPGMQGPVMMPKGQSADGTMIMQTGACDCQPGKSAKGTPAKKQ